jgi:hypothetical protein
MMAPSYHHGAGVPGTGGGRGAASGPARSDAPRRVSETGGAGTGNGRRAADRSGLGHSAPDGPGRRMS